MRTGNVGAYRTGGGACVSASTRGLQGAGQLGLEWMLGLASNSPQEWTLVLESSPPVPSPFLSTLHPVPALLDASRGPIGPPGKPGVDNERPSPSE